jgi:hypothetical protein
VNHSGGEYVSKDGVHRNTVEGFFSRLKKKPQTKGLLDAERLDPFSWCQRGSRLDDGHRPF